MGSNIPLDIAIGDSKQKPPVAVTVGGSKQYPPKYLADGEWA